MSLHYVHMQETRVILGPDRSLSEQEKPPPRRIVKDLRGRTEVLRKAWRYEIERHNVCH